MFHSANRRPLIVEFSGMPKTGKDKILSLLEHFFRRTGRQIRILRESARACPFDKVFHAEFTLWGFQSIVNSLLEELFASEVPLDMVFLNRGIFDTLSLLKFLESRRDLSASEYGAACEYLLETTWRCEVDIVFLFHADAATCMEREHKDKLIAAEGRIMNLDVLGELESAYEYTLSKYRERFRAIITVDAASSTIQQRAKLVRDKLLLSLENHNAISDAKIKHGKVLLRPSELIQAIHGIQEKGNRIVLVKGTFDSLHKGHLQFLHCAKRYGDCLIVAIVSDAAVRVKKGNDRPVRGQSERVEQVSQLGVVNFVTLIDDHDPSQLIQDLQPDCFVTTNGEYAWDWETIRVVKLLRQSSWSSNTVTDRA